MALDHLGPLPLSLRALKQRIKIEWDPKNPYALGTRYHSMYEKAKTTKSVRQFMLIVDSNHKAHLWKKSVLTGKVTRVVRHVQEQGRSGCAKYAKKQSEEKGNIVETILEKSGGEHKYLKRSRPSSSSSSLSSSSSTRRNSKPRRYFIVFDYSSSEDSFSDSSPEAEAGTHAKRK